VENPAIDPIFAQNNAFLAGCPGWAASGSVEGGNEAQWLSRHVRRDTTVRVFLTFSSACFAVRRTLWRRRLWRALTRRHELAELCKYNGTRRSAKFFLGSELQAFSFR